MTHGVPEAPYCAWSPITERRFGWPNGARVAVCFVVSLGYYDELGPDGGVESPTPGGAIQVTSYPDYPTVTHRAYGHRVGIFRLIQLFDAHAVSPTVAIDAETARRYPWLVAECIRRGWEIVAHGVSQRRPITSALSEDVERRYIGEAVAALTDAGVDRPAGWLGPQGHESHRTPRLLAEAGLRYVCDWANDEQPYRLQTPAGDVVAVPLMTELSDAGLHWTRRVPIARWAGLVKEAFDVLWRDGATQGRLLALPLHPWCIGQPFRVKYLEEVVRHVAGRDGVWIASAREVANALPAA
jgi:peptidoglycan/xylan/chitin deacetylase (PgdA/CDA1 family)